MYGGVRLLALVRRLPRGVIHGNFVTSLALSSPRVPQAYVNGASLFSTGTSLPQRKYTKRHEWISMKSGGKDERVGVTNYAQDALGDIVFVQLPDVGTEVKRYQECGALESVKAASDVYAPLDGMCIAFLRRSLHNFSLILSFAYPSSFRHFLLLDMLPS